MKFALLLNVVAKEVILSSVMGKVNIAPPNEIMRICDVFSGAVKRQVTIASMFNLN